jgi:ribonuclease PH
MSRLDGREWDELRPVKISRNYLDYAPGSVLIEFAKTRVLVAVSIEERVPDFLAGTGQGWLTAEYGMLPKSVRGRINRTRIQGRSYEIQRLIGRSLRSVTDLTAFGPRTLIVDCDVIQADGGTRSAAITGAYIALVDAFNLMQQQEMLTRWPLRAAMAAISVGIVGGQMVLDLDYSEDSEAEVDFNVVMTDRQELIEVQGTAESRPFPREALDDMLTLASHGIEKLISIQKEALKG